MHHTWGTPMHPLPPRHLTARSVSSVCLRGRGLCATCDWVGKTAELALQGRAYVFDHHGEKRVVVIESQPSVTKINRDGCVPAYMGPHLCTCVLEQSCD